MSAFEDRGMIATPDDFEDVKFAKNNIEAFRAYVELKIQGYASGHCLRSVFGLEYLADGLHHERIYALERNPEYKRLFNHELKNVKPSTLWSPQVSINELLQLIRSPFVKDAARLAAIKELNVMYNIVVVDEKGNTKAGRSLDDFYTREGSDKPVPGASVADDGEVSPTTH